MYLEQSDSAISTILKNLCCSYGWSYGVFWRFDQRNSLLLTIQEAYYEEPMGILIDNMLLQVHMLGGGIIGRAAFTKKHQWMSSDHHYERHMPLGSDGNQDLLQDDSELYQQFSAGIKTIAVVSVGRWGVVQFGSTQKILEKIEFIDHTRRSFQELENNDEINIARNTPSSLQNKAYGPGGLFASLISSGNSCSSDLKHIHTGNSLDMIGTASSSCLTEPSFFSASDGRRFSLHIDSFCHENHLGKSDSDDQSSTGINFSAVQVPSSSTWSSGASPLSSLMQNAGERHFPERTDNQYVFEEILTESDFTSSLLKPCLMDDLFQWFTSSSDNSTATLATTLNEDLVHSVGLVSPSSDVNNEDYALKVTSNYPANSLQSSVTNASNPDVEEKYFVDAKSQRLDSFLETFSCGEVGDWNDILMPIMNCGDFDFSSDNLECISEQQVAAGVIPPNCLLSRTGLEVQLDNLASCSYSISSSTLDDQSSPKRRRTESSLACNDRAPMPGLSDIGMKMSSFQQAGVLDKKNMLGFGGKMFPKSENNSWQGQHYSISASSTVLQTSKLEKPAKIVKKKVKKGSRPRPKDRQQIQDRMLELRELIPNGEKMSIDCLLAQTIKNLMFLQSVTKHAERIKQTNDPMPNEECLKDNFGASNNGVTWACEVGDQSIVCPLIVEDIRTTGHMHIEMLCEEQGFFLEIVDVIRGFGLSILKGMMEIRDTKIWARFIVMSEGNKIVTRHEVFSSLLQLLQMKTSSGLAPIDQLDCSIQKLPAMYDASAASAKLLD